MNSFHLEIMSPDRPFYKGDCLSAVIPLADGAYGIMAGHEPLTAAVVPGEISFSTPDGKRTVCAVSQGMISIGAEGVRVLCESVLLPGEIDEEKERREAETAAENMKGRQSYRDYMLSQITFARAINNLRVKKHDAAKINNS